MKERRRTESYGCEFSRRIRYERRENEPPSIAAAVALARYRDEDVTTASTRLYDYVDPEALDALFADTHNGTTRSPGTVEFAVDDATVTIDTDHVEVGPTG
ncbi:HalOD1 output domain-containing protein [Halosolutus gelatinilyticus]|uniref:HalOD1 output domain-containing protein n=1 Tax=Halosolutus gelatinilyticus TaxID=2931975 RepID=UPI001FF44AEF|nr:HalOD1 output domain-containing protein [Halosolutus gelatinilyticus]